MPVTSSSYDSLPDIRILTNPKSYPSTGNISKNQNSSMILKGILAVPSIDNPRTTSISPENCSPNASRVASPNGGKKLPSTASASATKERTPKKNTKKRQSPTSVPQSPPRNEHPSNSYFASSAFLNSPDPLTIPLPNFDDDDDGEILEPHYSHNKTTALWQLLQVK
jgi:hypothetical protein